jgi:tetratricopeptide (TPR) repeat protein
MIELSGINLTAAVVLCLYEFTIFEKENEMQDDKTGPDALPEAIIKYVRSVLESVVVENIRQERMLASLENEPWYKAALEAMRKSDEKGEAGEDPFGLEPARLYLATLKDEIVEGNQNAKTILAADQDEWAGLLEKNAAWVRYGTFQALLAEVEDLLPKRDTERAHFITLFVLKYIDKVPSLEHVGFLKGVLSGKAWLGYAKSLFALHRYDEALMAIGRAEVAFPASPVFILDRAAVGLLRARVWTATGHDQEALPLFMDCAHQFVCRASHLLLVDALCAAAEILCHYQEWRLATSILAVAKEIADRLQNQIARDMFLSAAQKCAALGLTEGGKCPDPEVLAAFVAGTLDGHELASVKEHLLVCDQCLSVVEAARAYNADDEGSGRNDHEN